MLTEKGAGVNVFVGVLVRVAVRVGLGVMLGVIVSVGVLVIVGVNVIVGVKVIVGVSVIVGESVVVEVLVGSGVSVHFPIKGKPDPFNKSKIVITARTPAPPPHNLQSCQRGLDVSEIGLSSLIKDDFNSSGA